MDLINPGITGGLTKCDTYKRDKLKNSGYHYSYLAIHMTHSELLDTGFINLAT